VGLFGKVSVFTIEGEQYCFVPADRYVALTGFGWVATSGIFLPMCD
jgi:hypothetical protein